MMGTFCPTPLIPHHYTTTDNCLERQRKDAQNYKDDKVGEYGKDAENGEYDKGDGGQPENCRDLVFPVSFPTGRLQHGELLQQVGKST